MKFILCYGDSNTWDELVLATINTGQSIAKLAEEAQAKVDTLQGGSDTD